MLENYKKKISFGNRGAFVRLCIISVDLLFISCDSLISPIEFEVEDAIVVNSLITPDSLFSCHLSKLAEPMADVFETVPDAKVFIFNDETNDTITELKYKGNGWYRADIGKPEIKIEYRLEVNVQGYDKITANTSIPHKGRISNITFEKNAVESRLTPGEIEDVISFIVIDSAGESNYYNIGFTSYSLNVFLYKNYVFVKELKWNEPYSPKPDESIVVSADDAWFGRCEYDCISEIVLNEGLSYKMAYSNSLFFSDELFDGGNAYIESTVVPAKREGVLVVATYSKDLYNYQKSLIQQQWEEGEKQGDLFQGKFSFSNEQVEVVSNIKNGYGIFAGYNVNKFMVVEAHTNYWWEKYLPEY